MRNDTNDLQYFFFGINEFKNMKSSNSLVVGFKNFKRADPRFEFSSLRLCFCISAIDIANLFAKVPYFG